MSFEDDENEMKADDCKMFDDVVKNEDDTEDRLAVVYEKLKRLDKEILDLTKEREALKYLDDGLGELEVEQTKERFALLLKINAKSDEKDVLTQSKFEAIEQKTQLLDDLQKGKYFAKSDDIFPFSEAIHVPPSDIYGKSDSLYRAYDELNSPYGTTMRLFREALSKHLEDESASIPAININTPATSLATQSDESSAPTNGMEGKNGKDRVKHVNKKVTRTADEVKKAKAKACIINGATGHGAHQGPRGSTCAGWWVPIYLWMTGIPHELNTYLTKINDATDEETKKSLMTKLHGAMLMLACGTLGGSKGMRDTNENLLYVPNPHDDYYDNGCNWVIYPVMNVQQMLNWTGDSYEVAIWAGKKESDPSEGKDGHWIDRNSKHNAEAAEKAILSSVNPDEIDVCSTSDLQMIAEGMGLLGPAIADLHMSASDESTYKLKILDLSSAIGLFLTRANTTGNQGLNLSRATGLDEIRNGLNKLEQNLQENGMHVPKLPSTNNFGPEKKHVYKTQIKQTNAPDPLVVAAKGLNNLLRQWGTRLMPGCPSYSSKSSSDSGSVAGDSTLTPTYFVGAEIAIVTPPSHTIQAIAKADNTVSDDDTSSEISAISFDDVPSF